MFTHWMSNFSEVVQDAYGTDQLPFKTPTTTELRTLYEAGMDPDEALAQLEEFSGMEVVEVAEFA